MRTGARADERGDGRANGALRQHPARRAAQGHVRRLLQDPSPLRLRELHPLRPGPRDRGLEVEGLWLGTGDDLVIQPNMLFNVDIWLYDGKYGLRYEDGLVVTEDGVWELTSYRREIIEL